MFHGVTGECGGVNRTDRLYALVEELRAAAPQWRSASSLADHFEVSKRTIERDLSALQQAGVPIYATPGRRGGYALDLQHTLPPLNLSAAEVAAVASALAVGTSTPQPAYTGSKGNSEEFPPNEAPRVSVVLSLLAAELSFTAWLVSVVG